MDECKSFISAFVSGVIHIVIGHPFDTIKTLQQSRNTKVEYQNLFRGMMYPVTQNAMINAVTFGGKHHFQKQNSPMISYMYCGIISTLICTPLDAYKIMRQYNLSYCVNIHSFLRTYRQTHIVAMREMPATFLYFATYDYCRHFSLPIHTSGALAGIASCIATHPIDTMKTRIQSNECPTIFKAYQKGRLWNGLTVSLTRSALVNAVNFTMYEYLMECML